MSEYETFTKSSQPIFGGWYPFVFTLNVGRHSIPSAELENTEWEGFFSLSAYGDGTPVDIDGFWRQTLEFISESLALKEIEKLLGLRLLPYFACY